MSTSSQDVLNVDDLSERKRKPSDDDDELDYHPIKRSILNHAVKRIREQQHANLRENNIKTGKLRSLLKHHAYGREKIHGNKIIAIESSLLCGLGPDIEKVIESLGLDYARRFHRTCCDSTGKKQPIQYNLYIVDSKKNKYPST